MCIDHPAIQWGDCGQTTLTGDLLTLANRLDEKLTQLGNAFAPQAFQFPTVIEAKDLCKMDYLHSFPQHATFPMTLDDSHTNLNAFKQGDIVDNDLNINLTQPAPVKHILTPAVCYHFYIHHQNRALSEPLYLTSKGTCYRRETHYKPLERQWNFSMRELVCIGSRADVDHFLSTVRTELLSIVESMGINAVLETATDPFFDPKNNPKYLMQKIQPNKEELIFDNTLAIASINTHRNYFGEAFNITHQGEPAFSGCVAFGLERWIAVMLKQFGHNAPDWPVSIASSQPNGFKGAQ